MGSRVLRLVTVVTVLGTLVARVDLAEAASSRLVDAAATQDINLVRVLVNEGIDVNEPRADGVTALLWAAHWDDLEMATLLINAGADVNAADDHGVTSLERACENASLRMVQTLLTAGATVNVSQNSGLTPLMTAARTGSVEVVKALLAAGANTDATTLETQSTALMWAVSEFHPDIVKVLLAARADPNASTTKGFTPLMYAARNGDIAMIKVLMAEGVDINATGADGTHVLPFAIVNRQAEVAHFLIDAGADPNGMMGGVPALHAAAGNVGTWLAEWYRRHGRDDLFGSYRSTALSPELRLPLVKSLLSHGADPNGRITSWAMFQSYIGYPKKGAFEPFSCGTGNLQGATPLWVAAYAANGRGRFGNRTNSRVDSSAEILQVLLDGGADQYLTTHDGTTPFMMAAGLGQATYTPREPRGIRSPSAEKAIRVLLKAGAEINATNEADFTALHGAAFRGLNEVIEYLVAQGANIDARDFRGRTAYRMAEGSKQSFQFQSWPETAELLETLGANTHLGVPGTVQERIRDISVATRQVN